MLKRIVVILVLLVLSAGIAQAKYTTVDFSQKTITHAFEDSDGNPNILVVASKTRLTPSGMDTTGFNLYNVEKDSTTGEYIHYIKFFQKGVLRLKAGGKTLTVNVIDLQEQIRKRKKQTEIQRLEERVNELELDKKNLTLKVNSLEEALLMNQSRVKELERVVEQNYTVHDQVQFDSIEQARVFGDTFAENQAREMSLNPLTHKGSSLVTAIMVLIIMYVGGWWRKQTEAVG